MKACVLSDREIIKCEDIEKPDIRQGEVLVKIKACGICSSDFNRVYGDSAYFYPIVLGHEFSGEIVECAEDINKTYLSKHVAVFPLLPCNECEFCRKKQYAQCRNYKYFGSRNNGAMTEYISVPFWNIKILPDDMDFLAACLSEPAAVACHAAGKIRNLSGEKICILGSGTIGILCGLAVQKKGADVTFFLRNKQKEDFLRGLGFKNFVTDFTNEFDVVIECVGSNDSVINSIKLVKSKGEIIAVGNPSGDMRFDKNTYWKLLRSEITLKGVWNSDYKNKEFDDWDAAIDFLYKNQNTVKKLITHKFKLTDCGAAFDSMKNACGLKIKGVFINE